ncbi:MAG: 16S rRNA (guanine(527)-N(7))-methyltransferase RsmG [Rudaea sp.]|uniref:16S rRNA (guanine(527)-N(7))-methyltransferase RsmG n=1 Tax=Rudaea sp. TaxID=2136325 RepID=UPI0039E3F3B6
MPHASALADRAKLHARLHAGADELGIALTAEQAGRLLDYLDLLARWNAVYNLTAVRDPAEMVTRHLLDSLAITPLVRGGSSADLGAGAGLPGIPLAILAPERQFTLVDSNGKKTRFLRETARVLGLANARVEQARVEELQGQYDCLVARAFAALGDILTWGGHLLAPDGVCIAMKGVIDDAELRGLPAGFRIEKIVPLEVPGLGAERHAVVIRAIIPGR